ncbi:MAG: hypothetical protein V4719_07815 [Planctomycetota bacterium]
MKTVLDRSVSGIAPFAHMPFLARRGDRAIVVFGQSQDSDTRVPGYGRTRIGRLWKLRYSEVSAEQLARKGLDLEESVPLETGLERNEVECSPCLFLGKSEAHLSFIGTLGHGTGPLRHRLYRMSGTDLAHLAPAQLVSENHCYCGFWRPDLMATGTGDGVIQLALAGGEERQIDTGFARIARISYRADFLHHLMVTGSDSLEFDAPMRTFVYDMEADYVAGEILADGRPTYKPALYGALLLLPEEVSRPASDHSPSGKGMAAKSRAAATAETQRRQAQRTWRLHADRQPQLVAIDRHFRPVR